MNEPMRRKGTPLTIRRSVPILAVVLLLAWGGWLVAGHVAPPSPGRTGTADLTASAAMHPRTPAGGPPPSSGAGTFFANVTMPFPAASGHGFCTANTWPTNGCYNITAEPSIVALPGGSPGSAHLALAYTAVSNATSCASMTNYTSSLVAFVRSTNGGANWTSPRYLGPTNCSAPNLVFPDAWQPSLAVLSNGTIALAYIQFNLTFTTSSHAIVPWIRCDYTTFDRLVLTESYDGGNSWTPPAPLANGSNAKVYSNCVKGTLLYHPSLAAYGNTLYLAYSSVADPLYYYVSGSYGIGDAHLLVSTDGGTNWSAPIALPGIKGSYGSGPINLTLNPQVAVSPGGKLLVSYVTSINVTYGSVGGVYQYATPSKILVAESTNNGTTMSYTYAGSVDLGDYSPSFGYPPQPYDAVYPTTPQIAFDPSGNGRAYLTYVGFVFGFWCTTPQYYYRYCNSHHEPTVYVRNSTDNGTTFGSAVPVAPQFLDGNNGTASYLDTPSVAVTANGTVFVQFGYTNGSICLGPNVSLYVTGPCAPHEEFLTWSADHGGRFAPPLPMMTAGITGTSIYGDVAPFWWYGEYSAIVASEGNVFSAFATEDCLGVLNGSYCGYPYYGGSAGQTRMVVAFFYEGATVTVSATETGLPAGTTWSFSVGGNVRSGSAGTTLSVSGVPKGIYVAVSAPWTNRSYGVAYYPTGTAGGAYTTNTTVTYAFAELLLVALHADPPADPGIFTGSGPYYSTLTVSPAPPSDQWVPRGTTLSMSVSWAPVTCTSYCYYYNISFVSWTGQGTGSVSTNQTTISVTPTTGPINETLNDQVLQYCYGYAPYFTCYSAAYALSFAASGLPASTTWSVAVRYGGTLARLSTGSGVMTFNVPDSLVAFQPYAVPGSNGQVYEPSSTVASPVLEPINRSIPIAYTLTTPSNARFLANVTATGLPGGSSFGVRIDNASVGGSRAVLTPVDGGRALPISADPVLFNNGTGYVATSATLIPYETATHWTNLTLPGNATFNSSGRLVLNFVVEHRLTVQWNAGGSVSPSSQWVLNGATVQLTATPDASHFFVGWQGSGGGSTGTAQRFLDPVNVTPTGPVTEIATFRPDPAPTWNVTIVGNGLPNGTPFSFRLGGNAYQGLGSVRIGWLPTGSYPFAASTVASNASNGTRYVVAAPSTTLGFPSPGLLDVDANGTVWLNYTTEVEVSVAASSFGSVAPGTGPIWRSPGSSLTLTATPAYLARFLGWNGTGPGAPASTDPSITFTVVGPCSETAGFQRLPNPPPATYALAVTEVGLPAGLAWNASAGAFGSGGVGSSITIHGLNGSYQLTVPPVGAGPGDRWVSNASSGTPVSITSNASFTVAFTEQFFVLVEAGVGGRATGGGWYPAGSTATLSASPDPGMQLRNWTDGSGSVSGTAPTLSVTVQGPTTERASFSATPGVGGSGSAGAGGLTLPILAFVLLALVGLAVGWLLARRRPSAPDAYAGGEVDEPPSEEAAAPEEPEAMPSGPAESEPASPAPAWEEPPPEAPVDENPIWSEDSFDPALRR